MRLSSHPDSAEADGAKAPNLAAANLSNSARRFPFLVGSGIADITPPLEVGLLMSSVERRWAPFEGVRLPLHARALVIEAEGHRVAVVSLELLGLSDVAMGGMSRFRQAVIDASGGAVGAEDLVLTSIHTHSAPETLGLSDLHRTPAFQGWLQSLSKQIGAAVRMGAERVRPCSMAVASTTAAGLGIHRRIKTTRGVLLSHPPVPADIVLSREGAVDDFVNIGVFRDEAGQVATLVVNTACHPVHEMCIPFVSPDYPGVMSAVLERRFPGAHVLFLNGADGNVNPPTVSGGARPAESHGVRLAEIVESALSEGCTVEGAGLDLARCDLDVPARSAKGNGKPDSIRTQLTALRVGDAAFCFLPGEPFAETGLAIRAESPFPFTFLAGYAEGSIGYIPTDEAFLEGGYETGPGAWSPLLPGCEPVIRSKSVELLRELHGVASARGSIEANTAVAKPNSDAARSS